MRLFTVHNLHKILQFIPALVIVLVIVSVFNSCTKPDAAWEPLTANKFEVSPTTVFIGQPVTISDGVCSKFDKPLDVVVNMSIQAVPPSSITTIPLITDQKITLKPGECTKSNSEAPAVSPNSAFQSGFYRLSLTFRTTSTTEKGSMKNQIIVLTSNDFQVITSQ